MDLEKYKTALMIWIWKNSEADLMIWDWKTIKLP